MAELAPVPDVLKSAGVGMIAPAGPLVAIGSDGAPASLGARLTTNRTPGTRLAFVGDSFPYNSTGGNNSGLTLIRKNGVVTVSGATSHPFYPGAPITVMGCANLSDEVARVRVLSFISTTSFTYASPGPDGPISPGPQAISIQAPQLYQCAGPWSHFNRLTNGAYRLVANCGISGATTDVVASRVASVLGAAQPDRVIWIAGYNDINGDKQSLAQTVANVTNAIAAYPGALWDVFTPSPWNSGAAADSAAHLRQLNRYYQAYKEAFKALPNVRVHNAMAISVDSTVGYAKTGYIKSSDNIHPSWRYDYELMKYLVGLDAIAQTGADLPTTALDTIGNDASSKCVFDNPLMGGSQAATSAFVASGGATLSGTAPTGFTNGAVAATAATTFTCSIVARPDGFGNDLVVTWTPTDATANTTNIRASIPLTTSRLPSGAIIDSIVAKVSLSGFAAGAANLKTCNMVLVWTADSTTYGNAVQECSADAQASVSYVQQDDLVDVTLCMRDIVVPVFATGLTLARLDFVVNHYGAGTAPTLKIGRVQVKLA